VSTDTLELIKKLLPTAMNGTLTERRSVGADMGQHEFIAYAFDPVGAQYKRSVLRITGDWEQSNTVADAMRLADILHAVSSRSR
jgi:hypothetical protein